MSTLRRGDTHYATITLSDTTDPDNVAPLDLTGKRVTSTCRDRPGGAVVYEHYIVIDGAGNVTAAHGMALAGAATEGVITETFASDETAGYKPTRSGKSYVNDVEVRVPGSPDVVSTPLEGSHTVTADITLPPD